MRAASARHETCCRMLTKIGSQKYDEKERNRRNCINEAFGHHSTLCAMCFNHLLAYLETPMNPFWSSLFSSWEYNILPREELHRSPTSCHRGTSVVEPLVGLCSFVTQSIPWQPSHLSRRYLGCQQHRHYIAAKEQLPIIIVNYCYYFLLFLL